MRLSMKQYKVPAETMHFWILNVVLEYGANATMLPFYREQVSFCLLFGDQYEEAGPHLCLD